MPFGRPTRVSDVEKMTDMNHIHFVVNPNAGGGRHRKRLPFVLQSLRDRGVSFTITETIARGHATELVRSLDGEANCIVAVGGDGTVNEVVNGLQHPGQVLGVVPCGRGNDFARLIGVATPARAAHALLHGETETFDRVLLRIDEKTGRTIEHSFINTMGVGFDAEVAVRVSGGSFGTGFLPYLGAVFTTLRRYQAVPATLSWDTHRLETELFLATLGNGTTSGGGFVLTPNARPDDGFIDLCLVQSVSVPRVLRILPKTFRGGHITEREVLTSRSAAFVIELASPLPVHADGEIVTRCAVRLEAVIRQGDVQIRTLRTIQGGTP